MFYETPQDRSKQREIAAAFAAATGCDVVELPEKSVVDYIFKDRNSGEMRLVEIRTRGCRYRQYEDYMLNLNKLRDVNTVAALLCMKARFVVQFSCGRTFWLPSDVALVKVTRSTGRTDRGDPNDQNDAGHVAWSSMFPALI